jgi:hypothetical protein
MGAPPDAYEFRTLVAEELARRGYSGVAVVTVAASRAAAMTAVNRGYVTPVIRGQI